MGGERSVKFPHSERHIDGVPPGSSVSIPIHVCSELVDFPNLVVPLLTEEAFTGMCLIGSATYIHQHIRQQRYGYDSLG